MVTWAHACFPGLCSSPYPVMCKEEGYLCLLGVPEASNIFSGPRAFPDSSQGALGQQVGGRLLRAWPQPSPQSLLESLTLPLGGGELERQAWGQAGLLW